MIYTYDIIIYDIYDNLYDISYISYYMLRPDSQPLTRFEAGRPASKRVSVSSFKAGRRHGAYTRAYTST